MKIFRKIYSEIEAWLLFLIRMMPGGVGVRIRFFVYCGKLLRCGDKVLISTGCIIRDCQNIIFGNNVKIGLCNQIYASGNGNERIEIGNDVAFNSNVMINADRGGSIKIGKDVSIGPNVVIRASNHKFSNLDVPIRQQGHISGRIVIEDNVWIGANAIILADVVIGTGSVIAAGAVVIKNVESFSIVGGVPAKLISLRK